MVEIKKTNDMTEEQFLWNVGQLVDSGQIPSWASVNDIVNTELGIDEEKWRDESSFRKRYQAAKKFYDNCFVKMESGEYEKKINELNRELQRNTIKYRDQRRAWNRQNYQDSRLEETLDCLEEQLLTLGKINFPEFKAPKVLGFGEEMLILLSDFHIGQEFCNVFGKYNTEIAKKRLGEYFVNVMKYADLYKVKKAHIVCLGDLISGNIHKNLQVTNKEDVNEQIKIATELISSFCYDCCEIFEEVDFSNVSGNHSRIDDKKDALHSERLDDIIGWAVGLSLNHIENFKYKTQRNLDIGICELDICGKNYIAVHGDFDSMSKQGVSDLSAMLGVFPDYILRGHMHSPALNEYNGTVVIQGGSLCGTGDQYTLEKRIFGRPSQTLCICNDTGVIAHIPVNLD